MNNTSAVMVAAPSNASTTTATVAEVVNDNKIIGAPVPIPATTMSQPIEALRPIQRTR